MSELRREGEEGNVRFWVVSEGRGGEVEFSVFWGVHYNTGGGECGFVVL